jgi:uncharacterized protein (DUF433 family)
MQNLEDEKTVRVPLRIDAGGAVRVGETRVSLLSVLTAFQRGDTPEQIVHSFPTLELSDVYAVISYYLANKEDVDAWLEGERAEGERIHAEAAARFDQKGIRERLLRRKAEQHGKA